MLLDVVIAACAAFAASGVVMLVFRLFGRKAPRWTTPVVASVAIVGVTAYLRYDWVDRTIELLPPEFVVVERLTTSTLFEPWSLVQPVVSSMVAVDGGSIKRNPKHPELVLVDLVMLRRDDDTMVIHHIVDCAGRRAAPLPPEPDFGADGLPVDPQWTETAPDALFAAVCGVARRGS